VAATLREHLANLVATLPEDDGQVTGELALWAAGALLQRGAVADAYALMVTVGEAAGDVAGKRTVAEALLRLARQTGSTILEDGAPLAEAALRRAVGLSPALATPALAQYLQRARRPEEAIAQWREAIRVQPEEGAAYLNLGRLYEQAGKAEQALATYLRLIAAQPTGRNYLTVAQRLEGLTGKLPDAAPGMDIKIALEGNATLDHLQSYLSVECYRAGLRPQCYLGGFDQYSQDILNPNSSLYAFAPDVVILAVHASRLFPRLHAYPFDLTLEERRAEIDAGLATLENLLRAFRQRSSALVLLHNMVAPQHPALGILDLRDGLGQAALFAEINARLATLVRDRFQNVYLVDEDRLQARASKARATDARLWFTARMGWSEAVLPELAREYLRYLTPYRALSRKCIVLDLDNTLWGGVIGEDGLAGIALGSEAPGNAFVAFQQALERLWRRGILLAICSKNNPAEALAVFDQHPAMVLKRSHFAAQRINWEPKPANIRSIAQELNIGLDSIVALDDSPVERAAIRAEVPQVLTPELPADPAEYRAALLDLVVFESLALTEEDRKRNQLYAEQKSRQELQQRHAGGSLEEYLADLQITVEIAPVDDTTLPRIAQLTNKTNQFNLTTRRYSEAQMSAMRDQGYSIYGMWVADRYGDNGLTGVAILTPPKDGTVEIDTLLLSCRVMGRGVENALLAFLAEEARRRRLTCLRGSYLPTERNTASRWCYRDAGFARVDAGADGAELWGVDLGRVLLPSPKWVKVRLPAAVIS